MIKSLKELCSIYKEVSDDLNSCCNMRSEYLRSIKNNHHFESLNEADISGLRPYLLCDILAIYEYLALESNTLVEDWFHKYKGVSCSMEDNDDYKVYKLNPIAPYNAESIYRSELERSIEPFKSRGISATCFDYTV